MQRLLAYTASAGLVATAMLATGCSTSATSEPTATPSQVLTEAPSPTIDEPTQSPTSPRETWLTAVLDTEQADAATMDIQLITNVEGFERITAGGGYVEMLQGYGDIAWTDDLGATREVLTANGHFLELDGTWFSIEREGALPTTVAFDPLTGLAEATNVVEIGTEDVGGLTTIRLDADLDARIGISSMGFSEEERTVFAGDTGASLIATIWIDDTGRIVRVLREYSTSSLDGDPIRATSLFLVNNLGEYQPIDVPETADAIPAPV